ncbi:MAG: GNAT family N-acetyltransferase [Methanocorpusculum sp.]|nr:GNAT family N-acetyltransferase [Methanocorpusculum sp.]
MSFSIIRAWDKNEIVDLYRAGGWWDMGWDSAEIEDIIKGSFIFAVAFDENKNAVGMGRIIADKTSDGYIQDVVVFSEYRNSGIGTRIVSALKNLGERYGLKWIGLISAPEKENFYKRAGFTEMVNYTPMLFEKK